MLIAGPVEPEGEAHSAGDLRLGYDISVAQGNSPVLFPFRDRNRLADETAVPPSNGVIFKTAVQANFC